MNKEKIKREKARRNAERLFNIVAEQTNDIVLARCKCHNPPRWAIFKIINSHRNFIYHGYDKVYAEKLFNSLVSKSQVQS